MANKPTLAKRFYRILMNVFVTFMFKDEPLGNRSSSPSSTENSDNVNIDENEAASIGELTEEVGDDAPGMKISSTTKQEIFRIFFYNHC